MATPSSSTNALLADMIASSDIDLNQLDALQMNFGTSPTTVNSAGVGGGARKKQRLHSYDMYGSSSTGTGTGTGTNGQLINTNTNTTPTSELVSNVTTPELINTNVASNVTASSVSAPKQIFKSKPLPIIDEDEKDSIQLIELGNIDTRTSLPQPPQPSPTLHEEDPVTTISALASSHHDGLSAVERAKRSAEEFTMNQLASRKRKAPSPSTQSPSDDDSSGQGGQGTEKQSHKKYQKRLQKNRDSAFVSRIRRREYTRILETSLSAVEKEKDAALCAFREMKRRFDVVSAELAGIKTAAASNFGMRDAFINRVTVPDTPFAYRHNLGRNNGNANAFSANAAINKAQLMEAAKLDYGLHSAVPVPNNVCHNQGPYSSTMYMVALAIGVLLPELSTRRWSSANTFTIERRSNSTSSQPTLTSRHSSPANVHSKQWMTRQYVDAPTTTNQGSESIAHKLTNDAHEDAVERLGKETARKTLITLSNHLLSLPEDDIEIVQELVNQDSTFTGVESLIRAVLQEDGSSVEGDDLDDIVRQVEDLSFDDRI